MPGFGYRNNPPIRKDLADMYGIITKNTEPSKPLMTVTDPSVHANYKGVTYLKHL